MNNYQPYAPANASYVPPPQAEVVDDVFALRRNTIHRKIDLLREQIDTRKKNLEENLRQIELDLCLCGTLDMQLPDGDREGHHRLALRNKLPLYKEKREQETDYLRDTAILRRELLDTILQYHSLQDKEHLLE
jgi:hypothetical protein